MFAIRQFLRIARFPHLGASGALTSVYMPSRLATAVSIAVCAVLAVCLPSIAFATPEAGFLGAELDRASSVLSAGELAAVIAIGIIPALVMIARERRRQRRTG